MAQSQCLCLVCGRNIDDHRDRRRLHSDVNKDSLSALVDIASHRGVQLDQLEAPGTTTYLCKHPCFSDVRRRIKLSGEVQSLDKKIADRLICTHNLDTSIYLPMPRAEVEPSPKRACLSARRQLTFTATESPEVQVRKHV